MKQLNFDVAVIGGGPAGTVAAIASARQGAKTILIEQHAYLGGAMTAAGTGPQMTFHAGEKQVVLGIPEEMTQEMIRRGFCTGPPTSRLCPCFPVLRSPPGFRQLPPL